MVTAQETSGEGGMGDPRRLAGYAVVAGTGLVAVGLAPRIDHGEWVLYGPFLAITAFGGLRAMTRPHLPVGGLVACALLWSARGIGALSEVGSAGYGIAYKAAAFVVFAGTVGIGGGTIVLARGVGRPKASGTRVLLAFLAWMVAATIAYGVPVWMGWCSRQIEPGPFCLDSPPWWLFVQLGLMIGAPWITWKKTAWLSGPKGSPAEEGDSIAAANARVSPASQVPAEGTSKTFLRALVVVVALAIGAAVVVPLAVGPGGGGADLPAPSRPIASETGAPLAGPLRSITRRIRVTKATHARLAFRETDGTPDCGGSILDNVSLAPRRKSPVFVDSFDGESPGLGVTGLANWTVTGNVDVIGAGSPFDLYPGNGRYLDLDGSPCAASTIRSPPIPLRRGSYVLSFRLGSNPYGGGFDNTLRVEFGGLFEGSFSRPHKSGP